MLLVLSAGAPRASAGEIIEAVVATVNGTPIFLSSVRQRMVPFLSRLASVSKTAEKAAAMEQLRSQLLQSLIQEELFRQEAERLKISVSPQDVEVAIRNVQKQAGLSGQKFWDAVAEQGLSQAQYRRELRLQLLRFKVLNLRARSKVSISDEDVRRRYDEAIGKKQRMQRYRVSHVFFALAEDATTAQVAETRKKAEAVASSVSAATFTAAVTQHGGGELGWLNEGDLPAPLEAAIAKLRPGQLSTATQGPNGYHIFLLHERQQGAADAPSFADARETVYAALMQEAMAHQEQQITDELKRQADIQVRR